MEEAGRGIGDAVVGEHDRARRERARSQRRERCAVPTGAASAPASAAASHCFLIG
jgi:hypothetical protein